MESMGSMGSRRSPAASVGDFGFGSSASPSAASGEVELRTSSSGTSSKKERRLRPPSSVSCPFNCRCPRPSAWLFGGCRCRREEGMEQELVLRLNHWALQELLSAVDDEGKLSRDCVLSGEVLEEGTRVLKVGGSLRTGEEIVGALQEAVMCKETIKVVFACPWMGCLSTMVLRWPCCTILLTLLGCIIIMVGGIRGIVLQTDMGAFMASDGESSSANAAFVNVLNLLRSNKGSGRRLNVVFEEGLRTLPETEEATNETWRDMEPRRLQNPSQVKLYKYFGFQIVYANDFNILNESQITTISVFEKGLRDLPEFKEVCRGTEPVKARFCKEGLSLANAVFPSLVPDESSTFGSTAEPAVDSILLDGQGTEAIPLSVAYRLLTQDGMDKAVLPTEVQGGTLDLPLSDLQGPG